MSSIPGYTLESYVAWNYNIAVADHHEANLSLGIAEMVGSIPLRPRLTAEQLSSIVAPFEEYRDGVENLLLNFDEDNQSWRAYAGYSFDWIPQAAFDRGAAALEEVRGGK